MVQTMQYTVEALQFLSGTQVHGQGFPRHQGGEGVAGTPGACSQVFCHPIRCIARTRQDRLPRVLIIRTTHTPHTTHNTHNTPLTRRLNPSCREGDVALTPKSQHVYSLHVPSKTLNVNTIPLDTEIHEQMTMTNGYVKVCTTTSTPSTTVRPLWTIT